MPFDPDKFLAESSEQDQMNAFDPDAFLAADDLKASSSSSPVSKSESLSRGAAQGATFGFGDEAGAAVDAAIESLRELGGSESSLAPGKSFKEKYDQALSLNRELNRAAAKENPLSYGGGQLTGGLPSAIGTGGAGLLRQVAAASGIGGLSSIGQSEDKSAGEATTQAVKDAALAGGLAGLLGGSVKLAVKGAQALFKNPSKAFKVSYDLEKTLTNPKVAQEIGQQIDDVGANFEKLSFEAREEIGKGLSNFAAKTQTRVNADDVIKDISKKINAYQPGRNEIAQAAKKDLNDALTQMSKDLFAQADEAGKVSFEALHNVKQNLSQTVFEQGLYSSDKYTNKLATQLYSGISNVLKNADKTGQYKDLSKVYAALSSSDPEAFTANALKYLQDPWDVSARGRLGKLLGDLQTMAPEMKQLYVPKLAAFIDNEFQDAALKAELLKNVGGKAGALVLKGVSLPNPSAIASDAGASLSSLKPVTSQIGNLTSKARSLVPVQGPIAGPTAAGLNTGISALLGSTGR